MDSSDDGNEVVIRSHRTTDLDGEPEEFSEVSTVQHMVDAETLTGDPSMTPKDHAINSILLYLMEEIKQLKSEKTAAIKVETSESSISDPDEESISTVNSKTLLLPRDWGRWKTTKSAEEARTEITKTLKEVDLANNEDNWAKWERYFVMLVNSLELSDSGLLPE